MTESVADILAARLVPPKLGWLDIRSQLRHFALITYAIPIERLQRDLPERFEVVPFEIGGRTCGLLSVVPFLDDDFHFARIAPFATFRFGQTNHRVYVRDRRTGEHVVWFFGTTLGSWVVNIARTLWRIPWHRGRYTIDCTFDEAAGRYSEYRFEVDSDWCRCEIRLEDTGQAMTLAEGFTSRDEMVLVLTHPVEGFFTRLDGRLGTYSVWHEQIPLTIGRAGHLYFSMYERTGLLTRDEMQHPHSVLICPQTEFVVHMPPRPCHVSK